VISSAKSLQNCQISLQFKIHNAGDATHNSLLCHFLDVEIDDKIQNDGRMHAMWKSMLSEKKFSAQLCCQAKNVVW
jgi:hypothetical protein